MSLDLKYRPSRLEDIYGSKKEIKLVKAHFEQAADKVSHSHIIVGPSGCGKTTLARAIAVEILGANLEFGVRELNTGDDRGIDGIRNSVIKQMQYYPVKGKCIVYIIDECHGLTPEAKRALLKPVEEAPRHVYFFFCTTDPAKFFKDDEGKALKTRLTPWSLEPLSNKDLGKILDGVLEKEGINVTDNVFSSLIESCNGSAREMLKNLEKIAPIDDEADQLQAIASVNANEDDPDSRDLSKAILEGNVRKAMDVLARFKGKCDVEKIRRGVMGYMTTTLLSTPNRKAALDALNAMSENTYDNGFPGLLLNTLRALGCYDN